MKSMLILKRGLRLELMNRHDAIHRYRSKAHLSDGTYQPPANSFAGGTTGGSGAGGC